MKSCRKDVDKIDKLKKVKFFIIFYYFPVWRESWGGKETENLVLISSQYVTKSIENLTVDEWNNLIHPTV